MIYGAKVYRPRQTPAFAEPEKLPLRWRIVALVLGTFGFVMDRLLDISLVICLATVASSILHTLELMK